VLFHANHVAHAGGFLLGAVMGYITPSRSIRRNIVRPADVLLGAIGLAAAVVSVALVIRPPASSRTWARSIAEEQANEDSDEPWLSRGQSSEKTDAGADRDSSAK
jgi:hypothetical protein